MTEGLFTNREIASMAWLGVVLAGLQLGSRTGTTEAVTATNKIVRYANWPRAQRTPADERRSPTMSKKPPVHIVDQGGGHAERTRIAETGVRVKRRTFRTASSVAGSSPKAPLPC